MFPTSKWPVLLVGKGYSRSDSRIKIFALRWEFVRPPKLALLLGA